MSLNWAMLNPDRTPVPLPKETTVTSVQGCADIVLVIPNAPPAGNDSAGGSGGTVRKEATGGSVFLTNQRLIYTTPPNSSWDSLSIPLHLLLSTRFHQPIFWANYLAFELRPSPDGGLTEGTSAELRFTDKPMMSFITLLAQTRERAIFMKREAANETEGLPLYTPSEAGSSQPTVNGPPMDNPPDYNG